MFKKFMQKVNKQQGSATVEAVVAFTGFILAIFTILSLVNLCRAQMLISNAMDNAAKELSQYAYFYKMSGLQRFGRELGKTATVGKEDVNSVIGSVDDFYSSVVGAVDDSVQSGTNIAEATKDGTLKWSDVETALNGVSENADNIDSSLNSMMTKFEEIGDNPMAYMKSLVAIAGSGGMELATSHLIAAPLAKMFVRQQFGGKEHANDRLIQLGVKDGLDGMNFKMSTMFTKDNPEDICLVVFYEVELLQLFNMEVLSAKLSKVSRCRAWLAGDDFQEIVDPTKPATTTPSGTGTESTEPGGTNNSDPTTPDNSTGTESTAPTEATEPETTGNTSTGNWALQHDPTGYYHSKRCEAFQDQFEADYRLNNFTPYFEYRETNGKAVGYDFDVFAKWEYENYETIGGNIREPGVELLKVGVENAVKGMAETHKKTDGTVQEFGAYTHVVYIPENMPESQYNALVRDAQKVKAEMEALIQNDTTGIPKDLKVDIVIVKGGGQYDYNSQEADYTFIDGGGR